jgi:peptide/nickel transport system substrate-binding protein
MRLSLAALGLLAAAPAAAQQLTIGAAAPITSLDPHFYNAAPNTNIAQHIFPFLMKRDAKARLEADLAESVTAVGDSAFEFRLRATNWADGRPVVADDVAFSLARVPNVPNSPGGFQGSLIGIARVEVVDARTVRLHTQGPAPLVPGNMSAIAIIPKHLAEGGTTADFNSGKLAVGAGPFRFVSYTPGERVVLERNDGYHGDKPHWQRVTFRFITNDASRVAALRAGDVDLIDQVPSHDLPRLASDTSLRVAQIAGLRLIYLAFDFATDGSPGGIADGQGRPLASNPLRDVRVRRALSIAINRAAITDRVMGGLAVPTGQWLPPGAFGYDAELPVPPFDPEAARKLLAEAVPQGLRITLYSPSDRYPNDSQTAQAIAQFWTRIGVQTQVEAIPWSSYAGRANRNEFGIHLIGWGSTTGEASSLLTATLATRNREARMGGLNAGGHSDPALDAMIVQGMATLDDEKREEIWRRAVRHVAASVAQIPLHQVTNSWVTRRSVTYEARADERTWAHRVFPAN